MDNNDIVPQEPPTTNDAPTLPPDLEPVGAEPLSLSARRPNKNADPNTPATLQPDETASPRRIKKREEKEKAAAEAAAASDESVLNATPTKTEEEKLKKIDRNKVFSVFLKMNMASEGTSANSESQPIPITTSTPQKPGTNKNLAPTSVSPFVPQVRSALRTCEVTSSGENKETLVKIDVENSEVPKDADLCTCPKYDPHLWKQVCKNCFHPLASHRDGGRCTHAIEKVEEYVPESIRQSISQRKQQTFADSQRGENRHGDAGSLLVNKNKSQRVQFIEQQQKAHNIMESMLNIPGVKIKTVKPIAAGMGRSWKNFATSKGKPPAQNNANGAPQRGTCISSTPIKSASPANAGGARGKVQCNRKSRFAEGIIIPFDQDKTPTKEPTEKAVLNKGGDVKKDKNDLEVKVEINKENITAIKEDNATIKEDTKLKEDTKEGVEIKKDKDDLEVKIEINKEDLIVKKEDNTMATEDVKPKEEIKESDEAKKDKDDLEVKIESDKEFPIIKKEDSATATEDVKPKEEIKESDEAKKDKDDLEVKIEVDKDFPIIKKEDSATMKIDADKTGEIKDTEDLEVKVETTKKEEEEEEEKEKKSDEDGSANAKKSELEQAVEKKSKELGQVRVRKTRSTSISPEPEYESVKKEELKYLRQTEYHLKDFIDDGNEEPPIQPLSDMFMTLISTAVTIAGIEDVPFVQDFLSGARIALSAKPEFAGMAPLTNAQLRGVKTVGKYSYILYMQQEFLKAVTYAQGMMTSKYMREYHDDNRRWMVEPFSSWSSSVKSVLRAERKSCERFDAYEDSESIAAVIGLHKDLCSRLEYICNKFPLSECWSIAAAFAPFIEGASHAYTELCLCGRRDAGDDNDGEDERRRNELLESTKAEFAALKDRLESIIKVYPDVQGKVVSNVEKKLIQDDTDGIKALIPKLDEALAEIGRAVALSSVPAKEKDKKKRKKKDSEDSDSGEGKLNRSGRESAKSLGDENSEVTKAGDDEEVVIKTPSKHSSSRSMLPLSATSSMRKSHSRRKKVKSTIGIDGLKHLPELPSNPSRTVVIEGSITATIANTKGGIGSEKELCAESEPRNHMCVLYNDYFVAYSEHSASPACVRLKDATIVSNKADGSFVLRSINADTNSGGNTYIFTKKYRPHHHGDLDRLIHQSIAKLRVFGVPLEDLLEVEGGETSIPYVAMACMDYIEDNGFSKEGIFRISGKPSVMAALREVFNGRSTDIDFTGVSPYDVAHLFKQFLAELPEPILTNDGYNRIMQLNADSALKDNSDDESKQKLIASLHSIIYKLPQAYKDFSRSVFAFLSGCESESYKNKMSAGNLAVVLAPSLLRPAVDSAAASVLPDMALIKKTNSMVKFLIENYFDIFI